MTIYDLKPKFQNLLRPIVKTLFLLKITPNQITIFTCLCSIAFSYLLFSNITNLYILNSVPLFFFVRMGLNAIDGILAKEFKLTSKLGALLNEITDVISDIFLYLAFMLHPLINQNLLLAFTIIAILTEFTGVAAVQTGSSRRFDGPMGKSDRAVFISIIALLLANSKFSENFFEWVLIIAITLSILTVLNRMKKALAHA